MKTFIVLLSIISIQFSCKNSETSSESKFRITNTDKDSALNSLTSDIGVTYEKLEQLVIVQTWVSSNNTSQLELSKENKDHPTLNRRIVSMLEMILKDVEVMRNTDYAKNSTTVKNYENQLKETIKKILAENTQANLTISKVIQLKLESQKLREFL